MLPPPIYHGPMATTRAIAALLVLVVVLAGCGGGGGGSKPLKGAAYVHRVNAIADQLDGIASNLTTAFEDSGSPATALVSARSALRRAARQLAAITPPPEIKRPHQRLVAAVKQLADDVTPLIARLQSGSADGLDPGSFSLKGESEAKAAIAQIVKAGYKIQVPLLS